MTTHTDGLFKDFEKNSEEGAVFGLKQLKLGYGLKTDAVWHQALNNINPDERDYLLAALRNGLTTHEEKNPRIELGTIHSAKGGESENVVLLTDMSRRSYNHMQEFEDDEARVFYVGVTRCQEHLHIIEPKTPQHFYT